MRLDRQCAELSGMFGDTAYFCTASSMDEVSSFAFTDTDNASKAIIIVVDCATERNSFKRRLNAIKREFFPTKDKNKTDYQQQVTCIRYIPSGYIAVDGKYGTLFVGS